MTLTAELQNAPQVIIQQRRELAELVGFETRNKYTIEAPDGQVFGYAAEQGKGFFRFFARQLLGHWRTFEILIFDNNRQLHLRARHPFRFFFQRLEVSDSTGQFIGALQQRFSILTKKFDVQDKFGRVTMTVSSPFWRLWTFTFMRSDRTVATISKKWGGFLKEVFTDADRFLVDFSDPQLTVDERTILVAAGLFIDLQYFENNQRRGSAVNILDGFGS